MSRYTRILLYGLAFSTSFACSEDKPKAQASTATTAAKAPVTSAPAAPKTPYVSEAEAKKQFIGRCASCHGVEGKGDGPGSVTLNPKPRNYTDQEWQKSVTDEQIEKTIMYGGAAVGKSPVMPASPELQSKPEVVAALVKVIRGFRSATPPAGAAP
jgi:cytochrome c553